MEVGFTAIYFEFLELLLEVKRRLPWKRARAPIGMSSTFSCCMSSIFLEIAAVFLVIVLPFFPEMTSFHIVAEL